MKVLDKVKHKSQSGSGSISSVNKSDITVDWLEGPLTGTSTVVAFGAVKVLK